VRLGSSRGTGTIEALIALVLFTMGALAAAGVAAVSLRSASAGTHQGRGAWLALGSAAEFTRRAAEGGGCSAFSPGSLAGFDGTILRWSFRPQGRGLAVVLIATYPTGSRLRFDTLWSFVPCQ
jgi:hypothetical protein